MSVLPEGWADVVLEDVVADIVGGGTPSKANESYFRGSIPFMTVKDMNVRFPSATQDKISKEALENSSARMIPTGTNIIATRMGLGKAVRPSIDVAINQDLKAIFPTQALDSDFLHWKLIQSAEYFLGLGTGTTVKGVRLEDVRALPIGIPPLPEQRRIVAKVDGLTARTTRARKELDRIPTLIARYKQRLLALAFSGDKFKNRTSLDDIAARITKGESPKWQGFEYQESGILFLRSQNVGWGELLLEDQVFLDPSFNIKREKSTIFAGDVLLNIVGASIGRTAVATAEVAGANCNQAVAIIRLTNDDATDQNFVCWWLQSFEAQEAIKEGAVDVARANFSLANIKAMNLPWPEKSARAEIVRRIESAFDWLDRMAADHAAAARLLPKLDAAILAKAFRGELVPQDPNDEPASVLLERIRVEREGEAKPPKRERKQTLRPPLTKNVSRLVPPGLVLYSFNNSRKPDMSKTRRDDDVAGKPYLTGIVKSAGKVSSPEALFAQSQLNLVDFYRQLDFECGEGWLEDNRQGWVKAA